MEATAVIGQAHETFRGFTGNITEITEQFKKFSRNPKVQIKSISLLGDLLSVGYIDGERYPVHLQMVNVDDHRLDESLAAEAELCDGDVICHSLFMRSGTQIMAVLFLVQGD